MKELIHEHRLGFGVEVLRIDVIRVGHHALRGQVEVALEVLAVLQLDRVLVVGRASNILYTSPLLHSDVQLLQLVLGSGTERFLLAGEDVLARSQKGDGLGLAVFVPQLAGYFHTCGSRAGNDDMAGFLDPGGGFVEEADQGLIVGVGLPGGVVCVAGSSGENEVVVDDFTGLSVGSAVAELDFDGLGGEIRGDGFADDELVHVAGVWLEGFGEFAEHLLVWDLTRDNGADGGDVPVKMSVLEVKGVRTCGDDEGGHVQATCFGDEDDP